MNSCDSNTEKQKPHYFKFRNFWYCRMNFRSTLLFGTGLTRELAWMDYLRKAELFADRELQKTKERLA